MSSDTSSLTAAFGRLRTGLGYDVHAFASNRKLILGGVEIPHHKALMVIRMRMCWLMRLRMLC